MALASARGGGRLDVLFRRARRIGSGVTGIHGDLGGVHHEPHGGAVVQSQRRSGARDDVSRQPGRPPNADQGALWFQHFNRVPDHVAGTGRRFGCMHGHHRRGEHRDGGPTGLGFAYTLGGGGAAVRSLIDTVIADVVAGHDPGATEALFLKAWAELEGLIDEGKLAVKRRGI